MSASVTSLTWTCHVCGERRPDRLIGVHSRHLRHKRVPLEMRENVRFCRDRSTCLNGAAEIRWAPVDEWETLTVDVR